MVLLRSGSNGYPPLVPRDLTTWSIQCLGFQPVNSRVRETSQSLTTFPLRWMATIFSLLHRFVTSCLATLNTQYLGFYSVNSRVREISRSLPLVLSDGWLQIPHYFAAHEAKGLPFWSSNVRVSEMRESPYTHPSQ
jgi:hypothetical protein